MLSVNGLHVAYGPVQVLQDVTLEARPGELVTIVGANGAGKSTLLKAISGLVRPTSGSILLGERRLTDLEPHQVVAAGVAHVPEGRHVFPGLTVEENLHLGAYLESDRRVLFQRKAEVFRLFPRLEERRRQLAGTLSGGEQQMLAIGRGLMAGPKVLLLDEPSLGLAPLVTREISRVIQGLQELGIPILLVEQNAQLALRMATRGYVLEHGKIALSGTGPELARDSRVQKAYLGG